MKIEKLAKHLKEFTLDEINMIAECDCKTELAHLLNSNKLLLLVQELTFVLNVFLLYVLNHGILNHLYQLSL